MENIKTTSNTFDGREVFLPIAVQLSAGKRHGLKSVNDPAVLTSYSVASSLQSDDSRIIYTDHYGNLISGIRGERTDQSQIIIIRGLKRFYADYYARVPREMFLVCEFYWLVRNFS